MILFVEGKSNWFPYWQAGKLVVLDRTDHVMLEVREPRNLILKKKAAIVTND